MDSRNDAEPIQDWLIVFLHGLESGPTGSKAKYIQHHFGNDTTYGDAPGEPSVVEHLVTLTDGEASGATHTQVRRVRTSVCVPDLEMSSWDVRQRNSAPRNFFNLNASLDGCAKNASERIAGDLARNDDDDGTTQASQKKILLVGSSWGGATAMRMIEKVTSASAMRPDKLLLLAPALEASGEIWSRAWPRMQFNDDFFTTRNVFGILVNGANMTEADSLTPRTQPVALDPPTEPLPTEARRRVLPLTSSSGTKLGQRFLTLLHGDEDDTVPVSCSRAIAKQFPEHVDYFEVQGGDHRLNAKLSIRKLNVGSKFDLTDEMPTPDAYPLDLRDFILGVISAD